jgi:dihydroorotase
MQTKHLFLRGGRVVCPLTNVDTIADVQIADGRVVAVGESLQGEGQEVDCTGLVVAPGFVDLGAELCDPGFVWREDVRSGSEAGAAGGFTTVLASPKTDPVLDTPVSIANAVAEARQATGARILISGALTHGLKGESLCEVGLMVEAGACAMSDGRKPVMNSGMLRRALDYVRPFGVPVLMRPGDVELESAGVMHEGQYSVLVGMRGIPSAAEEIGVARAIALARATGARVHLSAVTTANSIASLRTAKSDGLQISAAVPGRHLFLTDAAVEELVYDTSTRMLPPLRSDEDRQACVEGLLDGTIDCITADHVPHTRVEKELEYMYAKSGAMGLETAAGAALAGLDGNVGALVQGLSVGPAAVLGIEAKIAPESVADVVVFDAECEHEITGPFRSKGCNEPMTGRTVPLKVHLTIRDGCIIYGPQNR